MLQSEVTFDRILFGLASESSLSLSAHELEASVYMRSVLHGVIWFCCPNTVPLAVQNHDNAHHDAADLGLLPSCTSGP